MGFTREGRRVRDTTLPVAQRMHALGSCVQLRRPIGFTATWSYLQGRTGLRWRDPEILVPAIMLLEAEQAARVTADAAYARVRRALKAEGSRVPPAGEVTVVRPERWHGDERRGAVHVLLTWHRQEREPSGRPRGRAAAVAPLAAQPRGAVVAAAAERALALVTRAPARGLTPVLAVLDDAALEAELRADLDRTLRLLDALGPDDPSGRRAAWHEQTLLDQLRLLAHGAPAVATPWRDPARAARRGAVDGVTPAQGTGTGAGRDGRA